MSESKQDAPIAVRLYPPVKVAMEKHDPDNRNYFVNIALANMLGIPEGLLDVYRRTK